MSRTPLTDNIEDRPSPAIEVAGRIQVLEHTESTRLQYALVERAVALGWARSQVIVIDDDLGVSAAVPDSREGFARLDRSYGQFGR